MLWAKVMTEIMMMEIIGEEIAMYSFREIYIKMPMKKNDIRVSGNR